MPVVADEDDCGSRAFSLSIRSTNFARPLRNSTVQPKIRFAKE
jgi:hypothetical protein